VKKLAGLRDSSELADSEIRCDENEDISREVEDGCVHVWDHASPASFSFLGRFLLIFQRLLRVKSPRKSWLPWDMRRDVRILLVGDGEVPFS
jgi:hypothetical protein